MINKAIFKKILNLFSIEAIEQHLIHSYLVSKNIDFNINSILKTILSNFEEKADIALLINKLDIKNIKELEKLFRVVDSYK